MKGSYLIFFSVLLGLSLLVRCQPLLTDGSGELRQSKSYGDTLMVFGIASFSASSNDFLAKRKETKIPKNSEFKIFHSFRVGNLQKNQGSYTGKPLQGLFEKFYRKKLIEKGRFEQGLKDGIWHQWELNGTLKSIVTFKKGLKNGNYSFYENGVIVESGSFKNGMKQGLAQISARDSTYYLMYKNNVVVDTVSNKKRNFFKKK